jgi:hypothetical protein
MKHLSELLERLENAEFTYKSADSSMDSSPLQIIVAKTELKEARFEFDAACREYVMTNVLNIKEEVEA